MNTNVIIIIGNFIVIVHWSIFDSVFSLLFFSMVKMKHSRIPGFHHSMKTSEAGDVEMNESLYENITVSVFTLDIKKLVTNIQYNSVS